MQAMAAIGFELLVYTCHMNQLRVLTFEDRNTTRTSRSHTLQTHAPCSSLSIAVSTFLRASRRRHNVAAALHDVGPVTSSRMWVRLPRPVQCDQTVNNAFKALRHKCAHLRATIERAYDSQAITYHGIVPLPPAVRILHHLCTLLGGGLVCSRPQCRCTAQHVRVT